MKKFYLILLVFGLGGLTLSAQDNWKVEVRNPEVVQATFHGETPPLATYKEDPNAKNEVVRGLKLGYVPKGDWPLNDFVNPNALPQGPDPAWQRRYNQAQSSTMRSATGMIGQNFEGMGFSNVNPPDPVMDVGPNHIIQMINGLSGAQFQVWDKAGNSLVGAQFMDNFFNSASGLGGSGASGKGDPTVLYDQLADRWLMAEFAQGSNDIYILVSTTPDPTGTWYAYTFTAPNFPDYLKFAIWPDAYTMTSNENPLGIYAFDRNAMLAGDPATFQRFQVPTFPTINFQAATPVGVEGSTPPPMGNRAYFMRMADDAWAINITADRLEIFELDVDFDTPGNSVFSGPRNLPTDPFDTELCGYTSFSCMDQPNGGIGLDPLREVLMFKVQYRNFGTHESIVCNHVTDVDNTDRGGIRWYELRRTGGGVWNIYQQGTYSPDGDDRWMGAININSTGQIGLLYNRSSTTTFPGIYYTGRNASDPLGTMTVPEGTIIAGSASNPSNRYGDYSSLSVDPSDETTFWGTAEYNPSAQWSTRITSFSISAPLCDIAISNVEATPETCAGDNDGTITITATCTTCTGILYSIDGGTTFEDNGGSFTDLAPGTYMPMVKDSGDDSCNATEADEMVAAGAASPADPTPGPATRAFCPSAGLNASLDNTGIRVSNLGTNEKVVWILKTAPSGSAYTADQVLTPAGCPVSFTDLGELAIANSSRVIRVQDVANALPGTYTFEAYIENCTTGCISNTVGGFSITVNEIPAVPTIDRQDLVRCRRQTATISVLPATDVEFVWEVLEAPNGVSFAAGDKLEPNVDGSDYRTDIQADGSQFRTKGSARAGLYRFKVLARDVNTMCESELTTDELSILIEALPEVPTVDVDMAMGCAGSTGGDVSVVDPVNADLAVSWEVLEAPTGATISMGDILAPGTSDSHYRTTVPNEPYTLRIKSNNSVTPGTYKFKAFFTNTSTTCVGDATTEEFVVVINENPADPIVGVATKEFCNGDVDMPNLANTGISVSNTLTADEKVVWVLTSAPAGSAYAMDDEFTTDNCGDPFKNFGELAVGNSSKVIRIQDIANAPIGTYTFDAFITNCVTGCSSEPVSGFSITVNETPAVPSVNRLTRASCVGSTSTVSVLDPGTGLEISWEVVAAPAGASFMAGDVLDANVDGLDYRTDLDANGMRLRIKGAMSVAVGTYQFKAKAINSATGCESELTTEILEINIFAQPTVDISADPDGDLCLGQLDVMYDATITSTDGGTYTYDWCAYNSGDGSGTCFGGFDDNTIQMPKRSWTSSAGPKSVGVTVMSDVQGCMATDLYSFEVVAPTMLACPANQTVTLITDDVTFDCLAEATFNNPTIIPGPCDPVILTISVDGGAPETVIAGEPYTASFMELGMFTVTYDSEDAVGNTSTCSFDISVDGLPCGLVDNGGVGCNTSTSMFDQDTETFSLTSDCAPNTMLYTEDQTAFVFTELCGDGEIIAQVTGISGTGFAGVMLRESEMADAKKMALGTNTVDRLRREVRVIDGYPSSAAEILSLNQFWIRITRSGDVFSAFASTDGVFWQPYLSQVIIMGGCIRAGLYTYSEKVGNPVTAIFTDVSITGLASLANLGAPIAIGVQGLSEGLSLESEEGLRIYPNPTKGELNVNLSNFFGAAVDIRIFNSVGQIVQREQLEEVQVAVERFDVSRLNAGMYNVVVKVGETIWTERVVIMK